MFRTLTALVLAVIPLISAARTIPLVINHHGRLLDNADHVISGAHDFAFTLFTHIAPSGDGSYTDDSVWTETNGGVTVTEGLYSVDLGKVTPIDPAKLTGKLFLEISVDGNKLSPRLVVAAAPFAVNALNAGDSDTLGGHAASDFVQVSSAGDATIAGKLTAAKLAGDGALLTNVPGSAITGKLADTLLSSNVPLTTGGAVFAGNVTATAFVGSGAQLTNLPIPTLPTDIARVGEANTFTGANAFTGQTTLGATSLGTATFGAAASFNGPATFNGTTSFTSTGNTAFAGNVTVTGGKFIGDGSGLTNIGSGIMPVLNARPSSPVKGTFLFNTVSGTIDLFDGAGWKTFAQQAPISCAAIKAANSSAPDGLYFIAPPVVGLVNVWCDMTTDGGGWTVVYQNTFNGNDGGPTPTQMSTVYGTAGQTSNYGANAQGVFANIGATKFIVKETTSSTVWLRFNNITSAQFNNIWSVTADATYSVTTSSGASCNANMGNHGHSAGVVQFNNGGTANAATVFEYNILLPSNRDTNHYWHIWPACNGTYAVNESVGGARIGALLVK